MKNNFSLSQGVEQNISTEARVSVPVASQLRFIWHQKENRLGGGGVVVEMHTCKSLQ